MDVAILFTVFVGGLVLGIPVAITLGLSSLAYLLYAGMPPVVMPQKMYAGMDVFVLLSVPGFILAGNLMNQGGITGRIIRFANALVGWIKGGLGLTNIVASMLFGGITGTAVADAASLGGVLIPGCVRLTDVSVVGESPTERKGSHHFHREPCACHREVSGEASVAACAGQAIEPRNRLCRMRRDFPGNRRQHFSAAFG